MSSRFDLKGRSLRAHTARGSLINAAFLITLSSLGFVRGFVLAAFLLASDYGVWGLTTSALLIVVVGLLPVIALVRGMRKH